MNVEDALRQAHHSIGRMPDDAIRRKLASIQSAREARGHREVLRQQQELDALELGEAAYQNGTRSHEEGDLRQAARWYRAAALSDYADASLKLAVVLDAMAEECAAKHGNQTAEELTLTAESLQWYATAFGAGEPDAADLLDALITRLAPFRHNPLRSAAQEPIIPELSDRKPEAPRPRTSPRS
jgi:TPR repeat protein